MTALKSVRRTEKGFTLLEIIVVVAIIGIAAAIAVPSIRSFSVKYNFRSAAFEIMTTLMQARTNAARDNGTWQVVFDNAANTFDLTDPNGNVVSSHGLASYGNGTRLLVAGEGTCGNATSNWNNGNIRQANATSFSGRGTSSPNSFYIKNQDNDACYAISTSNNGVVRLHRYDGHTPFALGHWD